MPSKIKKPRVRKKEDSRKYSRTYRERNLERARARERARWARRGEAERARRLKDPEKEKARAQLRNAVAAGKIVKPGKCDLCPATRGIQAHHHDYSKPFDVEWICAKCHGLKHRLPALSSPGQSQGRGSGEAGNE